MCTVMETIFFFLNRIVCIYIVDQKQVLYTLFQKRKYSRYRISNVVVSIRGVHCPSIDREYTFIAMIHPRKVHGPREN